MNRIPVTTAAKPVLPPRPIPVALSTYAETVLVPNTAPIMPPTASAKNAFSIPTAFPSSSMNPHCLPNAIRVPVVSKNVTNTIEKIIIIRLGIFLNNCPNPLRNPPNNDKSKLILITFAGRVGINTLPLPNPAAVNITPIMAVITNPTNTDAVTSLTYNIKVMRIPTIARSAGGDVSVPIETMVDGSATIIPAPFRPKNLKEKSDSRTDTELQVKRDDVQDSFPYTRNSDYQKYYA